MLDRTPLRAGVDMPNGPFGKANGCVPAGCDTLVATADATRDGIALFAKNSDREPNEAHQVIAVAAMDHEKGSFVKCTYIDIPQAEHTYALLLARPFWIWGAEMGVNEKGVAIGNEAVFTKVAYNKKPGLIGMDFLRLALERAACAKEAVDLIAALLEEFGQGGNCGFAHQFYYHNSFLIADPADAWVLETAGRQWAAKRIGGIYSISNGITLENEWDMASSGLVDHAVHKKWCKGAADFSFSKCYSDFLYTTLSNCRQRRSRTMQLLLDAAGEISVATMIAVLRDHGPGGNYSPDRGLTGAGVCMHAGFGPVRASQTTGSLVCHLHPVHPTLFVTGTAGPCTSIFKPVWIDAGLSAAFEPTSGRYEASTLFWQHEMAHRDILRDYSARIQPIAQERGHLEAEFIREALAMASKTRQERSAYASRCFAQAQALETRWQERMAAQAGRPRQNLLHRLAWAGFNRQARMPE